MLYYLLYPLREYFFGFNVFRYITFRAAGAAVTAFLVCIIFGPIVIDMLYKFKFGERVRSGKHHASLYDLHKKKEGTPTMGGVLIIIAILFSTILWTDIFNSQIQIVILSTVWLGSLGFIDDYMKLKHKKRGLRPKIKFIAQVGLAVLLVLFMKFCLNTDVVANVLSVPFHKTPIEVFWFIYLVFVILVVCGTSNAVNLTDGLDGLAIGCILIVAGAYCILSYIVGHIKFSDYLGVLYIQGSGELSIFCASMVGAGLGFLWFNSFPASVFMGDTGALTLGGLIGVVSVLIKKELWLIIVGGVFVIEALSVILQVGSFKLRGKRIFAMAPLHHHFEMKGWPENKVTIRFWILALIFALIGLGSLKLQ